MGEVKIEQGRIRTGLGSLGFTTNEIKQKKKKTYRASFIITFLNITKKKN